MFSGIVTAAGTVKKIKPMSSGKSFFIEAPIGYLDGLEIGASIAINGACQTVEIFENNGFTFYSSPETLKLTNLSVLRIGDQVNLEKSLTLNSFIDGHMVTGHVDCIGKINQIKNIGESIALDIELQQSILRLVAAKGSITVDGISLTVNSVSGNNINLMIIPHTYEVTTLSKRKTGDGVNIEADILAKYVNRNIEAAGSNNNEKMTRLLIDNGFMKG